MAQYQHPMFYAPFYSEEFLEYFAKIVIKEFTKEFLKKLEKQIKKNEKLIKENTWTQRYAKYARKHMDKVIISDTSSDHFKIQ